MALIVTLIILALALSLLLCFLYVFGTYLIMRYDRLLARDQKVSPGYEDTEPWPGRWSRRATFWLEVAATFTAVWLYPLGYLLPHSWKVKSYQSRPIILIHGLKHNQSGWLWMRHRLRKAGLGPIYSLNLKSRRGPIQRYAREIQELAEKVAEETGQNQIVLVGHSMGGLVASYFAEYLALPGTVTHVITLGSPLQGTRSASLVGNALGRQMRQDSHFIKDISKRIAGNQSIRYCHLTTQLDAIILPHQSGIIGADHAHQRVLPAHGHMMLLFSSTVAKQIIDWLKEPVPIPPAARVHDPNAILLPT